MNLIWIVLNSVKRSDVIYFLFLSKMHVFSTTVIHVHCSCFVDMVTHCGSWSCSSMDSVCNIITSWGPEVIGYGYIAQTSTQLQLVKWTYQVHSNNTLSDQSLTCRPVPSTPEYSILSRNASAQLAALAAIQQQLLLAEVHFAHILGWLKETQSIRWTTKSFNLSVARHEGTATEVNKKSVM